MDAPLPACSISVVIVSWNTRAELIACLESLRSQSDPDFELMVVDNASGDGSAEVVRVRFPEARLIALTANTGFAAGCNLGIEASRGEWVATLNPDTVAEAHWIERGREAIQVVEPSVGMLQSTILYREQPDRINSTGVVVSCSGLFRDRDEGGRADAATASRDVFCVSAGAAFYRRSMLDQTRLESGFFDPAHFMYFEDVDLGWRCRLAGWDAQLAPDAIVYHSQHAAARQRSADFVFCQCVVNRVRTLLKNASVPLLIRSLPRTLWEAARLVARGHWQELASLPSAIGHALAQRRVVSSLAVTDRRTLEARWVVRAEEHWDGLTDCVRAWQTAEKVSPRDR